MKILVRNLARNTSEAALLEMFEALGMVQSCTLVMDQKAGTSKGFGFVEMPREDEAKAAMKTLNGRSVDGQMTALSYAVDFRRYGRHLRPMTDDTSMPRR